MGLIFWAPWPWMRRIEGLPFGLCVCAFFLMYSLFVCVGLVWPWWRRCLEVCLCLECCRLWWCFLLSVQEGGCLGVLLCAFLYITLRCLGSPTCTDE